MATSHQLEGNYIASVSRAWIVTMLVSNCSRGPGGAQRQAAALQQEGVVVSTGSLGELSVDFAVYGWFPASLPSEEVEANGMNRVT